MKPAMIRPIDAQGRIILPIEIRRTMGISTGDILEIHPAENGIYLSKYKDNSLKDQRIRKFLHLLYSTTGCHIAVCDCHEILFSKGSFLKEGISIPHSLSEIIHTGKEKQIMEDLPITSTGKLLDDTIIPLNLPTVSIDNVALVLLREEGTLVTDQERICAKLVASLISTLE